MPVSYDLRVSIPISLGVYFTYQQKALVGAFSVITNLRVDLRLKLCGLLGLQRASFSLLRALPPDRPQLSVLLQYLDSLSVVINPFHSCKHVKWIPN